MLESAEYAKFFVGLIAITNPLGNSSIFLGLTSGQSVRERRDTARMASIGVCIILFVSALAGEHILRFFGISIPAFRISAGILILLIAIDMLHARVSHSKHTPEEAADAEDKKTLGIVPLAIPLLAGPGTMSVVIVFSDRADGWEHLLATCGIGVLVAICVWSLLRLSVNIERMLGRTGLNVFTRIMGLILAAIAVEFIVGGLAETFPGWTS